MKKIQAFSVLIEMKREFIARLKPETLKNHDGKSFTRKRKLTLDRLLTIIIRCSPFSAQIRLDDYFKEIGHKEEVVSKQAFSKARTNLNPDVVRESFNMTAQVLSSSEDLELFKNKYRLCAIDGSTLTLDNNDELLTYFGGSGQNHDCVSALASMCYDPLNNIVLDGSLYPYGTSEREAAEDHFGIVETLPLPEGAKNLYVMDRGYPSLELIAKMIDNKQYFLMRVRKKFNLDFDLSNGDEEVTLSHNDNHYQVRVIKVTLKTGEEELLVTNLPTEHMTSKEAGEVYFDRWKIETKFDSLKNKLELENMSGRRVITTFQDFWAKLDLANMAAALAYVTNETIEDNSAHKANKYKHKTNESRLITKFSDSYLDLLTRESVDDRLALFDDLVKDISRRPTEIKPDRSSTRKKPRKKKYSDRIKSSLR